MELLDVDDDLADPARVGMRRVERDVARDAVRGSDRAVRAVPEELLVDRVAHLRRARVDAVDRLARTGDEMRRGRDGVVDDVELRRRERAVLTPRVHAADGRADGDRGQRPPDPVPRQRSAGCDARRGPASSPGRAVIDVTRSPRRLCPRLHRHPTALIPRAATPIRRIICSRREGARFGPRRWLPLVVCGVGGARSRARLRRADPSPPSPSPARPSTSATLQIISPAPNERTGSDVDVTLQLEHAHLVPADPGRRRAPRPIRATFISRSTASSSPCRCDSSTACPS